MSTRMKYGFSVELPVPMEEAERSVRGLLKDEGFGVLTEIDVSATLREKLGVERRPYKILGACNPPLAHRALQVEPEIGLLLPCNVVVEETLSGSRVAFLDPKAAFAMVGDPGLEAIAQEAAERLGRVAQKLQASLAPAAAGQQ